MRSALPPAHRSSVLAAARGGGPKTLTVDLADVEFMDSSGLNVMVDALTDCQDRCRISGGSNADRGQALTGNSST